MSEIKDAIRGFLLSTSLAGEPAESLRDSTPLQTSGVLDSMAVLGLAGFIERQYGVALDVYDMSAERFDRIDDIAALVARKVRLKAQPA